MANTRKKGNVFQNWCATWLEDQGYEVVNQHTVVKRTKGGDWITLAADIFDCDIIAIKTGKKPLFIQATMHSAVKKRLDAFLKHPWPLEYLTVQLWMKKDKEINIKQFDGEKLVDHAKIIKRKLYTERRSEGVRRKQLS